MKKITILCMLTAILLLWGCSQEELPAETQASTTQTTQATEPTTQPTTAPTEPPSATAEYTDALTYIALPYTVEEAAPEGKTLATYRYPTPSLILPDAEVSETITLDLLNRIDKTRSLADKLFSHAITTPPQQYPYYYNISYNPVRLDKNILSIAITEDTFDGTAYGSLVCKSVTYDLVSGHSLSLSTILNESYSTPALIDLILEGLSHYSPYEIYEEHPELIRQMFSTNLAVDNWYLSAEGLCFYFAPYEIGPHASGTITSSIPYEKLSGLLKDAYFPMEAVQYVGKPVVKESDSSALLEEAYSQFAELDLDGSGSMLLLYTDGSVSDLVITHRFEENDPNSDVTVFYAQGLGPELAVMIEASPKTQQRTTVLWRSGSELGQAELMDLK